MFEKLLSSIGIGSAKVNTLFFEETIVRGSDVKGEIHIFGGKAEQIISEIYVHIDTEFHKYDEDMTELRDITEPILEIKIMDPMTIKPNEEKVIPFTIHLPHYIPTTFREQQIHLQTELNINVFTHPVETHDFVVRDPFIDKTLQYLEENGFEHSVKSGLCRYQIPTVTNPTHCLQTFELANEDGVKLSFVGNAVDLDLYVSKEGDILHHKVVREKDVASQLAGVITAN